MAKYKIRSITLHVPPHMALQVLSDIESYTSRLLEAVDTVASETGHEIETARIVTAVGDPSRIPVAPEDLGEAARASGVLISIGPVPSGIADKRRDELLSLAENGVFFNIVLEEATWEHARIASEIIHAAAEKDPSVPTLFGVNTYGKPLVTPYYPLASPHDGDRPAVTASLTYPSYLLDAYRSGGYKGIVEAAASAGREALGALEIASTALNSEALGVDLSVAPWMEESSLALVEYVAGVRMPEPGFLLGVYTVNRAISEAASLLGEKAVGFNELQLPIAEDLKLKKRVAELDTTARDLARFSCVCLAGLDLAVVPASVKGVAGLILDVAACSLTKNKPLGVRIVPLEDVEPGEKVWLDKFGETPVIPL